MLGIESWLPRTKLVAPAPASDAVIDPVLLARAIGAATSAPLTLIAAPAGAGKTTLAAAVVAQLEARVVWVSLDELDDDPRTFVEVLVLAFDGVVAGGCRTVHDVLCTGLPAAGDPRRAMGALVNDLVAADAGPVIAVLDDLHIISSVDAVAALDYLVAHLPATVHVVATTRTQPPLSLSRLRAQGQLVEISADDLRLTDAQAETLLNTHLGLALHSDEVVRIVDATAGWVTGIRLLARSSDAGAGGLPALTGGGDADALDAYLAAEVVDREPAAVGRFLRDTSVLDQLDPATCTALTGRDDAEALLADLHRRNRLLVLRPDVAGPAYRYHDLLRSFLRRRLRAEDPRRAELLHRAAADVVASPMQRVDHLLAAGASADAADAVEAVAGSTFPRPADLQRVATWIARLPPHVVAQRHRLQLLAGLAAVQRGAMSTAIADLEPALVACEAAGDFAGQWLAARSLHLATNDHGRFAPLLSRLEASAGFTDLPAAAQVDHHVSSAYAALFSGAWPEVARRMAAAVDRTVASGDIGAVEVLAQHISPLLAPEPGALERIASYATWTEQHIKSDLALIRLGTLHQRAFVALLTARFDEALSTVRRAGDLPERLGGLPYLRATLDWIEAGVACARGDLPAAERSLRRGLDAPDASDLDRELHVLRRGLLARVLRLQHRGTELATLVDVLGAGQGGSRYGAHGVWAWTSAVAQAAWAKGDLLAAASVLRGGVEVEDASRLVPFVVSLRLDLAVVLHQAGCGAEALDELATVAARARSWGAPGWLAVGGREALDLLRVGRQAGVPGAATFDAAIAAIVADHRPAAVPVPGSVEVLSSREIEVLHLLDEGASNRRIADELVVSENTVKTHVRNVTAKLRVTSRGEAVAVARRLHLL